MTRSALNQYKRALEAKRTELVGGPGKWADIAIEKTPDAIDEVQFAGERELAISTLDREYGLLCEVEDAMSRIADGTYGTCLRCDEEITRRRLDAVPWAKHCVQCQETLESLRRDGAHGDSVGSGV